MGTPGFDAPELDLDPRLATPATDVLSLGRIAAWFLSETRKRRAFPPLPDGDKLHWRPLVRACANPEVPQRVQTMDEFAQLVRQVFATRDEPVKARAARLIEGVLFGEQENVASLLSLAHVHPGDFDLHIDYVARIPTERVRAWAIERPERAASLASVMAKHLINGNLGDRDLEYATTPLTFILSLSFVRS